MSDNLVQYEVRAGTALLTMNRPDRHNALSRGLIDALTTAFIHARGDSAARCVILTGAGRSFCAGMDLAELQTSTAAGKDQAAVWDDALRLGTLYDLIYSLPKPTVAAVNGAAVAGGAGLVTVCDLAVAVPTARFGYPEVRRGLVAAMVLPHLLRHVGERAARHLLLTGDLIDATEAARIGLVNTVSAPDELLNTAFGWSKSAAEGGPVALAKTKELLQQFSNQAASVREAAEASAAPRLTEECRQGLEAFFAKRPAPWVPR